MKTQCLFGHIVTYLYLQSITKIKSNQVRFDLNLFVLAIIISGDYPTIMPTEYIEVINENGHDYTSQKYNELWLKYSEILKENTKFSNSSREGD